MYGKKVLNQLNAYQQGMQTEEVKKQYNLEKIVKLSSNENPFGYSKKVETYLNTAKHELSLYPDGYSAELREAVSKKLNVDKDEIVFGGGSDELVQIISRTFLDNESSVVMAVPSFPQYKHHAMIEGSEVREVPVTETGHLDLAKMLEKVDHTTKIVWICTPNNPTGCVVDKEDLINFLDQCPKETIVILDEAYYEFVRKEKDIDSIGLLKTYDNVMVLRTFSKAYGLAGIRLGYGIGNKEFIHKLNIVRGAFNTSSIAQKAAKIALEDEAFIEEIFRKNREIRDDFADFLTKLGWSCYESETNFLLVKTPIDDMEVFQALLEKGFIVRPGKKIGVPNTIRITIGHADDMNNLKEALRSIQQ